ncbi:MAG TPA: diguanylate cyclase [Burkholderiales bacterium]
MTEPAHTPGEAYTLDGIEVVELWEVDLDFAVEEAFREGASQNPETTRVEPATSEDVKALELFQGLDGQDVASIAPRCQSICAVPGYVLLAPGRLNTKIFFVVEGQLRLYAHTGDKRPMSVADVGHSTGLRSALAAQPANHAVIATEVSRIIAVELSSLDELAKRSHTFARNYAALLASYLRGDNCLNVGTRGRAESVRQGYIDELTLLHNQHWLDTVFPRLIGRYRMGDKKLAIVAFAVNKLDEITRQHGIGASMRALETIGPWLLDQTRPTDILAIDKNRHFLAFLPDCDLDAARQLAGRLKAAIKAVPIALPSGKTPATTNVTAAVGIAELESGMNEHAFLNKVDALIQKSLKFGGDWLSESLDEANAPGTDNKV